MATYQIPAVPFDVEDPMDFRGDTHFNVKTVHAVFPQAVDETEELRALLVVELDRPYNTDTGYRFAVVKDYDNVAIIDDVFETVLDALTEAVEALH